MDMHLVPALSLPGGSPTTSSCAGPRLAACQLMRALLPDMLPGPRGCRCLISLAGRASGHADVTVMQEQHGAVLGVRALLPPLSPPAVAALSGPGAGRVSAAHHPCPSSQPPPSATRSASPPHHSPQAPHACELSPYVGLWV